MGGQDDGRLGCSECLGEFVHKRYGEVVGRLIQEQHMGAQGKHESKVEAALLPDGKVADVFAQVSWFQQAELRDPDRFRRRHGSRGNERVEVCVIDGTCSLIRR